jgi:[ribosomal protein S5]-alanine N-acetyltransferase
MIEKIFNKGYKYKPLKTKRLFLIMPDLKYKEELYQLYKDKNLWIYNGSGDNKNSRKIVEKQILRKIDAWKKRTGISFFITYENKLIGTIGIFSVIKDFKRCEMGFMLHSNFCSKGFMSEALKETCKFIFKNTCIRRISADVCTENIASIKVLEKNKFKREGLLRKSAIYNGKVYDEYLYALVR